MSNPRNNKIESFLRRGNPADDPSWREFTASRDSIPREQLQGVLNDAVNRAHFTESEVPQPVAGPSGAIALAGAANEDSQDESVPPEAP